MCARRPRPGNEIAHVLGFGTLWAHLGLVAAAMTRLTNVAVLMVGLLAPGPIACAGARQPAAPPPLVGCHYFVQDDAARDLRLPWGVQLLDQPLAGWPAIQRRGDVRQAVTLTGWDRQDFPFGYWIRTSKDSVEIGYPAGGGILLRLATDHARLVGTARPVGDVIVPGAPPGARDPRPVALTRARCPEE